MLNVMLFNHAGDTTYNTQSYIKRNITIKSKCIGISIYKNRRKTAYYYN